MTIFEGEYRYPQYFPQDSEHLRKILKNYWYKSISRDGLARIGETSASGKGERQAEIRGDQEKLDGCRQLKREHIWGCSAD